MIAFHVPVDNSPAAVFGREHPFLGMLILLASAVGLLLAALAFLGIAIWFARWFLRWVFATVRWFFATSAEGDRLWKLREAEQKLRQEQEALAAWQDLVSRFGEENAARVMRRELWQGQTIDMLLETHGIPAHGEQTVKKSKVIYVAKYDQMAKDRYRLKVTLENGIVVGWESK